MVEAKCIYNRGNMANQNHCMSIKQAKLMANAHNVLFYVCSQQGDIRHTKRGKTLTKRKKRKDLYTN